MAHSEGSIYLGRDSFAFNVSSTAGNLSSVRLARLSASSGAVDVGFNPFADTQPSETASVLTAVPSDASGRLFVGGDFASLSAGNVRLGFAALNANGTVDALSALTEASEAAIWIKLELDGDGGAFAHSNARRINGSVRRDLVRIQSNGAITAGFRPPNVPIRAFALDRGQAIYIADDSARQIRKIDRSTGDPIHGFTPISYSNAVGNLQVAGAHLYLYGSFTLNGVTPSLSGYARVSLASGLVDTAYRPQPSNGFGISQTLFAAGNNALILVGSFTSIDGVPRPGIAKLDGTTFAVDSTWNPSFVGGNPQSAAADEFGGVYISGNFTSVNGSSCRAPAKLLAAGAGVLDPTFSCARAPGFASALALNADALYAGSAVQLVRFALNEGGALDPNWSATVNFPGSLAADAARVYVLGSFTSVSGVARSGLAALPAVERTFANGFE